MSSLETAVSILNCFSDDVPELGVSDVADRLKIPKSTVSRLMKAMAHHGLVDRHDETRRYRVGLLPFRLGSLYRANTNLLDLVDDALAALVEETGFTGYVGTLNDNDIVILRMRAGRYPVRIVLEPGVRVPAFATAFGKHLLSRLPNDVLRDRLPPNLNYEATKLRRSQSRLLTELEAVRERGWADADEETFPGIGAIGTSVGSADGQTPIGLALSYPISAVPLKKREQMVGDLLDAARRIAQQVGDPLWVGR